MSEEIDGNTATKTAVDAPVERQVTTEADLTNLFMGTPLAEKLEGVEVNEEEESQAEEEPEDSESTEESESETEEVAEESDTEEDEDEEEEEEEQAEGEVLSQQDKTIKKLLKRNKKITKGWRTAEEDAKSAQEEIANLKQQLSSRTESKSSGDQSFEEIAINAETADDLAEVYEKAEKAEEWIEDTLDQLRDSGEDSLIVGEREYTRQEIKAFRKEVKKALKTDIPKRAEVFEQRQQYDTHAVEAFPFLVDPKSDGYKHAEAVMQDKGLEKALKNHPAQTYLVGLLAEGLLSHNAKKSKQSSSGEDKTRDAVKKPASAPKIAPSTSFVRPKVAAQRSTQSEKSSQAKKDIMKKGNLNERDLTQLFM